MAAGALLDRTAWDRLVCEAAARDVDARYRPHFDDVTRDSKVAAPHASRLHASRLHASRSCA